MMHRNPISMIICYSNMKETYHALKNFAEQPKVLPFAESSAYDVILHLTKTLTYASTDKNKICYYLREIVCGQVGEKLWM